MPFFPQAYISPQAGLFQILSALDTATESQQKPQCVRRYRPTTSTVSQTFTPHFDVTEVDQAYELFGEVPGLEHHDLSIEFADAQTLVIKGKMERGVPTSVKATPAVTPATKPEQMETSSEGEKSHSPTVEDEEYDEADTPLAIPATTATVTATAENPDAEEPKKQDDASNPKYWVSERRVGPFARNFSFSQIIEQDAVTASLRNGVLHIVVPKSQKSKKIAVRVN